MRIWLDRQKLNSHGVTAQDVTKALQRENVELPAGRIETDTKAYSIKVKGEFQSVQHFGTSSWATTRVRPYGCGM